MHTKLLSISFPITKTALYPILTDIRELNYKLMLSQSLENKTLSSIEETLIQSILSIEIMINSKLAKEDKIHFTKNNITAFIELILTQEIVGSFYHQGPVIILNLEKDQLIRRIDLDPTIPKNIQDKIRAFQSPEIYLYLISNIFIKYLLPENTPKYY